MICIRERCSTVVWCGHWTSSARTSRQFQGVKISFTADGDSGDVDWDASLCLYRVTQEALRNVAKHADARHVRVELSRGPGSVRLSISDDGKGFDEMRNRGERHGLGLVSIDERVRLLRGTVQIETRHRGGTRLRVNIPHRRDFDRRAGAHCPSLSRSYPRESLLATSSTRVACIVVATRRAEP